MKAETLRKKFLEFFKSKGHAIISSASLVPENDPTTLFITAGMHPLVPYLIGEKHPEGKKLANIQKCIRTTDIDDVGDNTHLTFFEMLGNWSLGDYFKKEAIEWSFEFLTDEKWLGLDPRRLYVSVFAGDEDAPKDEEAIGLWKEQFQKIGIKALVAQDGEVNYEKRIVPLGKEDNWWGPAGETGPCGPDTEMFYDVQPEKGPVSGNFQELVKQKRLIEIWNDVFMEYNKKNDGTYEKLTQQNVDTGMGLERTLVVLNGKEDVYQTELFRPIIELIEKISGKSYGEDDNRTSMRIIADHLRASAFIVADGVRPSNVQRGYILRRLIRRSIKEAKKLGVKENFTGPIAETVIELYGKTYNELKREKTKILNELHKEEKKFRQTLEKGLRKVKDVIAKSRVKEIVSGKDAFELFSTYGFPFEMTKEIAKEHGLNVDEEGFQEELKKHQELSRTISSEMFKGGLADGGEQSTKLHTATHLLLAALRAVLGEHVYQKGSNIKPERLRLDFSHDQKLTEDQIRQAEELVNKAIKFNYEIKCEEMTLEDAQKAGAIGVFGERYPNKVKVYSIYDISKEICGGPHVKRTGELGKFRIIKEESCGAGIRRIKAILE